MSATDAWTVADPIGCSVCGREACEDHLPGSESTSAPRTHRAIKARDLMAAPLPKTIVDGLAWQGRKTVVVSESGTGKTFLLLDLSAKVSEGLRWHGRETHHGTVIYISFEGDFFQLRLEALDLVGHSLEHLHVIQATAPISPKLTRDGEESSSRGELEVVADLEGLKADLDATGAPPIVLVILDT